jgi:hypothetical protein
MKAKAYNAMAEAIRTGSPFQTKLDQPPPTRAARIRHRDMP